MVDKELRADYEIGGGWGNKIGWMDPKQFEGPIGYDTVFGVVGWKLHRPKVGDTLLGEFERSWMLFEFVTVDYKSDPPDMFFADVKIIKQVLKT